MLDLEAIKSVLINSIEPLREDNLIEDYDVFELDDETGIGFAIKKSNKWEEQRITSISSLEELIEYLESIDLPFGSELYKIYKKAIEELNGLDEDSITISCSSKDLER